MVDELCNEKEDQEQKSVLETLLSLNEGCEVITEQLNDLKTSESSKSPNVEVLLGSGKLFDLEKPCSQSRILAELMGVRNRTEEGRSLNSLTALIKHPVLIIFIREKSFLNTGAITPLGAAPAGFAQQCPPSSPPPRHSLSEWVGHDIGLVRLWKYVFVNILKLRFCQDLDA